MSQSGAQPAGDVYEVVTESPGGPKSWFRAAVAIVTNLIDVLGGGPHNPGGLIVSVREKATGIEVLRHVEDLGDDESYLLNGVRQDLAEMTAAEFQARWVD